MLNVAILDDYSNVVLQSADWSGLPADAKVAVFNAPMGEDEAAAALADFEVICPMRERTPLPRTPLECLPKLKLIHIVGRRIANLDMAAATELGIVVTYTNLRSSTQATPELTWAC